MRQLADSLPPTPNSRFSGRQYVTLLLLFVLALAIRWVGLGWGLPTAERWYSYHPDESVRQLVGAVGLHLAAGDPNPHFFNYPSLAIYATYAVYLTMGALGQLSNQPAPWETIRDIIAAGRLFTAVTGALTAPLVYLLAHQLRPGRWAILAGGLAAFVPGHVQHSHFATVDVPATFFVVACLLVTARATAQGATTSGRNRALILAAFLAGLAASTKYNGILVLIAPLTALFLVPASPAPSGNISAESPGEGSPARNLGLAFLLVVVSLVGFVVATPYALLSFREFWGSGTNGFAYELLVHPREGSGDLFVGTGNGWWFHLTRNLPFLMTWPLALAGLLGIFPALRDRKFWPLLAFCALYFLAIGTSEVRFMRYLLLVAPILALLAAYLACRLPLLPLRSLGALALTAAALAGTANVIMPLVQEDPRDGALKAIRASGKTPVIVGNPWFFTPAFQPVGDNVPVSGVKSIGWDPTRFDPRHEVLALSEYEWHDAVRLNPDGPQAQFIRELDSHVGTALSLRAFGNGASAGQAQQVEDAGPQDVPNPPWVPHDYLYTFPQTRVYGAK